MIIQKGSVHPINNIGWVLTSFGIAGMSLEGVVGKVAIDLGINPTTLLAYRFLIGVGLLGGTIALIDQKLLSIDKNALFVCMVCGAANAAGQLLFFWSLVWLNASLAVMILSLNPLVVLSILAAGGQRLTLLDLSRFSVAIIGVYLLIRPSGEIDWLGIALAMGATIAFAFQFILIPNRLHDYDDRTITFYVVFIMTIIIVGFFISGGGNWHVSGSTEWFSIGVLAIISTFLARLALYAGLRRIGGLQTALLSPIELLLTVLWSFIFLGERLASLQLVGGGMIFVSALLAMKRLS